MKKMTKLLALVLAVAMLVTCFAGCGSNNRGNVAGGEGNTETDIKLQYWNSGFGSAWIKKTVERFHKLYPEYKVDLQMSASNASILAAMGQEDIDDTDIYIVNCPPQYRPYLEPLTDVYEMTPKNATKKVGEHFQKEWLDAGRFQDGNLYVLPAIGASRYSMIYNKAMFDKYSLRTPRTTNEASVIADALLAEGIPAFCSFMGAGYWAQACYVWYAQYEGIDYALNNYFGCKDPATGESPSKAVFLKKDGRYEIMKALQGMLDSKYVLQGSNSTSHTLIQTYLVQGKAAMMYNGAWLENEAASAGNLDNFDCFRLPLLSSITNKLSTVKSESDLRKLISAVDSVLDGEKTEADYKSGSGYKVEGKNVAAADWNHIISARRIAYGSPIVGGTFVPKYSTAIKGAKEFIAYMISEENVKAIAEQQHYAVGGVDYSKVKINTAEWTPFSRNMFELEATYTNGIADQNIANHDIFNKGGADLFANVEFISHYQTNNAADKWTADQAWSNLTQSVESKYLITWLANINS